MSNETTPGEGGQPPLEAGKSGQRTSYMVLWAPVPDEGEPLKWREIKKYEAYSAEAAKGAARDDTESGQHGAMLDVAKGRGFKLRAISDRGWPDDAGDTYIQETTWSTRASDGGKSADAAGSPA